jgi:protein-tyrosine phosphatase
MTAPDPARILVVCTANLARSPLAEVMLRHRLSAAGIVVSSAGVRAREGLPASDGSLELARVRGLDLSEHRSRQVTTELVEAADLVLTMSERQRDRCTSIVAPGTTERVFTIREFGRLLDSTEPGHAQPESTRLAALRERAHAARPRALHPGHPEDIEDPIVAPWDRWLAMGEDLDRLVELIAAHVTE